MRMNTTPTTISGTARLALCWIAPTSTPVAMEKLAGRTPRTASRDHHPTAIGRSARDNAAASCSSCRCRIRRSAERAGDPFPVMTPACQAVTTSHLVCRRQRRNSAAGAGICWWRRRESACGREIACRYARLLPRDRKLGESCPDPAYHRGHAVASATGTATCGGGLRHHVGRARDGGPGHVDRPDHGHPARDRPCRDGRASDHLAFVLPGEPLAALGACGGAGLGLHVDRLPPAPPPGAAVRLRGYRRVRGTRVRRGLVRAARHPRR